MSTEVGQSLEKGQLTNLKKKRSRSKKAHKLV